MTLSRMAKSAAIGASILGMMIAPVLAANMLTNGSFEDGPDAGVFTTLMSGDTQITDWTVGPVGSIDYIGTYWQHADGDNSIDLSGNEAGSISTTFDTVPGARYKVTFAMSGNPDDADSVKTVHVAAGTKHNTYTFDTSVGNTKEDMMWASRQFNFAALGTSTTLTFTSLTNTAFGPAIDNVIVELQQLPPSPTPTPSPTPSPTPTPSLPTSTSDCKKGGWMTYEIFKNQGDCVSYVATGGTNPPAGQL